MPLNLYRRHFRIAGKCLGGYEPDFRNYETDELRRGWKKCHCPIYADGTLGGKFKRRNTKKTTWREAKEVVTAWEAAGAWEAPDATAAVVDSEGWLHTGDLAAMRPDGYFSFRGRAKDTIIRGGENIYPREVEDFLHTHPKIADVYVIGIPDARLGETVLAWVQLKPGETATAEEIQAFFKGKIAYFKIPQYVRFVDGFPMTVTKKIQKFLMREQEIRERGLEDVARQATA
jgi:acyl-CoA synthetase (AMP-forming)/AMP-acid ligase II